jgi:hypothetical protein
VGALWGEGNVIQVESSGRTGGLGRRADRSSRCCFGRRGMLLAIAAQLIRSGTHVMKQVLRLAEFEDAVCDKRYTAHLRSVP